MNNVWRYLLAANKLAAAARSRFSKYQAPGILRTCLWSGKVFVKLPKRPPRKTMICAEICSIYADYIYNPVLLLLLPGWLLCVFLCQRAHENLFGKHTLHQNSRAAPFLLHALVSINHSPHSLSLSLLWPFLKTSSRETQRDARFTPSKNTEMTVLRGF